MFRKTSRNLIGKKLRTKLKVIGDILVGQEPVHGIQTIDIQAKRDTFSILSS